MVHLIYMFLFDLFYDVYGYNLRNYHYNQMNTIHGYSKHISYCHVNVNCCDLYISKGDDYDEVISNNNDNSNGNNNDNNDYDYDYDNNNHYISKAGDYDKAISNYGKDYNDKNDNAHYLENSSNCYKSCNENTDKNDINNINTENTNTNDKTTNESISINDNSYDRKHTENDNETLCGLPPLPSAMRLMTDVHTYVRMDELVVDLISPKGLKNDDLDTNFRYVMEICYDGSEFSGFQYQKDKRSVQGVLNEIFGMYYDSEIKVCMCIYVYMCVYYHHHHCHYHDDDDYHFIIIILTIITIITIIITIIIITIITIITIIITIIIITIRYVERHVRIKVYMLPVKLYILIYPTY
jgi:hypothetical protein